MQFLIGFLAFVITAGVFSWHYRREASRQRTLTWPRTTVTLADDTDALKVSSRDDRGEPTFYEAELTRRYVFYARGERHSGNRLAPELDRLHATEAETFLRELGKHRSFRIYYDPDNPSKNYLTAGRQVFPPSHLIAYAALGIGLPLLSFLINFSVGTQVPQRPLQLIVYALVFCAIVGSLVFLFVRPPIYLGELLEPVSPKPLPLENNEREDELLESLRKRKVKPQKKVVKNNRR